MGRNRFDVTPAIITSNWIVFPLNRTTSDYYIVIIIVECVCARERGRGHISIFFSSMRESTLRSVYVNKGIFCTFFCPKDGLVTWLLTKKQTNILGAEMPRPTSSHSLMPTLEPGPAGGSSIRFCQHHKHAPKLPSGPTLSVVSLDRIWEMLKASFKTWQVRREWTEIAG